MAGTAEILVNYDDCAAIRAVPPDLLLTAHPTTIKRYNDKDFPLSFQKKKFPFYKAGFYGR
jgi:hypothetical protein